MAEAQALKATQEDAYYLVETAVMMDNARTDKGRLALALERDLRAWVGIATLMNRPELELAPDARENMKRLATFVTGAILEKGVEMPATTLDTLININLQVSEGLLQGATKH